MDRVEGGEYKIDQINRVNLLRDSRKKKKSRKRKSSKRKSSKRKSRKRKSIKRKSRKRKKTRKRIGGSGPKPISNIPLAEWRHNDISQKSKPKFPGAVELLLKRPDDVNPGDPVRFVGPSGREVVVLWPSSSKSAEESDSSVLSDGKEVALPNAGYLVAADWKSGSDEKWFFLRLTAAGYPEVSENQRNNECPLERAEAAGLKTGIFSGIFSRKKTTILDCEIKEMENAVAAEAKAEAMAEAAKEVAFLERHGYTKNEMTPELREQLIHRDKLWVDQLNRVADGTLKP